MIRSASVLRVGQDADANGGTEGAADPGTEERELLEGGRVMAAASGKRATRYMQCDDPHPARPASPSR
jgi:hypothetical protein